MKRPSLLWPCLIFTVLLAVYVHTLNPAFRADDSPETITSCVTLGIQHPPGYPLHTLMGRLFSFLPLATPAWRLNFMAAFFGALACALLAVTLELWTGSPAAAAAAALLLGLSPTFWSQSLEAKGGIYTFHAAQLALLILCLTLWDRELIPRRQRAQSSRLRMLGSRYFLLSVLLLFVGFGNHWETQALFVPAVLVWCAGMCWNVKLDKSLGQGKGLYAPLWKAAMLAVLGLSVYLFLPLRAAQNPVMDWGAPKTWKQFLWVLQRQEYLDLETGFLKALRKALLGGGSWQDVATNWAFVRGQGLRIFTHLFSFHAELSFVAVLLSGLGAWRLWALKRWKELGFILALLGGFFFVVTFYFQLKPEMIWILDVFLIPTYLAQAMLAGVGIAFLFEKVRLKPTVAGLCAAMLLPVLIQARAAKLSQSQHYWAWDYGKNFLLSMKKNAIVFAEGDFNTMPIYYLQQVEGDRPDVTHITSIFVSIDWGVEQLERLHPDLGLTVVPSAQINQRVGDGQLLKSVFDQIIQKNYGKRPIQCSLFRDVQAANVPALEPELSPEGLSAEWRSPQGPAEMQRRLGLLKAMTLRWLPEDQSRFEPSPQFALSNYGTAFMETANYLRSHGHAAEAMPLYPLAVGVTTMPNKAQAYVHWGIALAASGKVEEGMQKFQESLKVKPIFEAYANLAGSCNQLKRYAQAQAWAQKAVELQPSNSQSWNNLAIALYYQGRQADAIAALQKAALLNPNDSTISNNLRALSGRKS